MNTAEQKKYELVFVDSACLLFRERQNSKYLEVRLGIPISDGFPKGSEYLGTTIMNAVSRVYGIALEKKQIVSHLRVSIISKVSDMLLTP